MCQLQQRGLIIFHVNWYTPTYVLVGRIGGTFHYIKKNHLNPGGTYQ